MRILIWIFALAALALGGAILVAAPGSRFGLWEFTKAFDIYRLAAAPKAIAGPVSLSPVFTAAALSLLGGVAAFFLRGARLGALALAAAVIAGGAGMIPVKMRDAAQANPLIHDITTDFENPPAIVAGAGYARKNPPEYVGAEPAPQSDLTISAAQRQAFPDIGPIMVAAGVEETAQKVRDVLAAMNLKLLDDRAIENGRIIEATYTSTWFGFIDDFVVRVVTEGAGARVDIRSKSRVGLSDLGANAKRVREFSRRLKELTG